MARPRPIATGARPFEASAARYSAIAIATTV